MTKRIEPCAHRTGLVRLMMLAVTASVFIFIIAVIFGQV